ncbi:MAG: hypothetical protein FJZ47_21185 [Candidatus Tectomicrobia bacterium]|uniref:Uncharacterized protein n=1 Tax=Tectimicrobiota bacterium TaxID=2528274 RepID=A0A937W771_UNCTE|nr:hypothetical protein [Candidatus Tectomicrobia bacterium]
MDVESSNVLVVKDVYGEDLSPPDVNDLMTGLVTKVRESFPLVQGAVLRADQKKVLVNLGRKASLKAQMKLLIFRCTGDDPAKQASTDEECDADTEVLDEAFVDEVSDERSQGTLRQGKAAIKEADRVITK